MRINKPIQVFEYDFLPIGPRGFENSHWEALGKYNDQHGGNFFRLTYNGVRFQQYVGVIQVGNLTIEILPKIGKEADSSGNKDEWQQVLIDMLRECNWMKIHAHDKASLQYKYNNILEAYLELFISECEALFRHGLIKKYRSKSSNCTSLKGKLLFSQNIQKNLVHQERFFTKHQVYDNNNIFNQIILKALKLVPLISSSPLLADRVYSLLLSFPELSDLRINEETFKKLVFDKKTVAYQEAIEIAAMLLLNYRPDISSGQNHVLAILFDMNDLWEEYIYRQIQRHNNKNWKIEPLEEKYFWQQTNTTRKKSIKPDIVINSNGKTIIIDTKWKLPEDNIPSDNDLKQMFVYNEYWDGITAILLYPHAVFGEIPFFEEGKFHSIPDLNSYSRNISGISKAIEMHTCGVMKISVLNEQKLLNENTGKKIIDYLLKKYLHET
ncbi:MAG: restriction endonuclease [Saprospiraceae bacterium]|nr:restriction endonuclease [Candidatus Vicinibacter affinis]MBK7695981.1 restriction endonuclease [Candidatus Vicinibacter affinis]